MQRHAPLAAPDLDLEEIEASLKVLGHPSRLRLLALLRSPRTVEDIVLRPHRKVAGQRMERPMSRQAVRNHLAQLAASGLVRVRQARHGEGRPVQEFILDRSRIFALIESLRQVNALEAEEAVAPMETLAAPAAPAWGQALGARLVFLNGPYEGRPVPLRESEATPPRGWVVGRDASCQVPIEYDPFLSRQQAEVLREGAAFRLLDLRHGRNLTYLNWVPLPKGGEAALRRGDVVRAGRTLLLFLDA